MNVTALNTRAPTRLRERGQVQGLMVFIGLEPIKSQGWAETLLNVGRYHYRIECASGDYRERCSVVVEIPQDVKVLLGFLRNSAASRGAMIQVRKSVNETPAELGIEPEELMA